ncbi:hypothetical protein M080_7407, partial [Bacteroides fragilis str. 3397 T10]
KGVSQKTCHSYLYSCFYSWDRKMADCKKNNRVVMTSEMIEGG